MTISLACAETKGVAVFSDDKKYRYYLMRELADDGPTCLFIMLNPSTATEEVSDPTVTRCINYARAWGYGALAGCNIFAYRATDPKWLKAPGVEPIGRQNDRRIMLAAGCSDLIVCAWGSHGELGSRGDYVKRMLQARGHKLWCFGLTANGQPVHPLYQPKDRPLMELPRD